MPNISDSTRHLRSENFSRKDAEGQRNAKGGQPGLEDSLARMNKKKWRVLRYMVGLCF